MRTDHDPVLLAATQGLSRASRDAMLRASLPSYLDTLFAFGSPPVEAEPPKGYSLRRWAVGGYPEPGPGGMTGWCTSYAYRAASTRDEIYAQGLACAVVLANGRDLALLTSALSVTQPPQDPAPSDFPKAPEKIAGSVRHRPR